MDERVMMRSIYDEDSDDEDNLLQMTTGATTNTGNTSPGCNERTVGAEGTLSTFPANIAAACHEASVARLQPKSIVVEDSMKLEKRRKCNRLSAQRWRMRKRSKFTDLQDKIRLLQKEHVHLEFEKSKLQAELRHQLALTKAQSTHLPPSFVNSRLEASQRALRLSQRVPIDQNTESMERPVSPSRVETTRVTNSDAFCFKPQSIPNKDPVSFQVHDSVPPRSPTFISRLPDDIPPGGGISHVQLMAMLRAAGAPCFSLRL